MTEIGVGVASGVPVPFIWERNGSRLSLYLVGEQASDGMTIRWEYECD